MRINPDYALDDLAAVRALVDAHPFGTLVSGTARGLVASHYPFLLEETGDDRLVLVGHVGRPDEDLHELGRHEVLVVVQGPHGYISPGWYGDRSVPAVPTWNFLAAHLYGTPQILDAEANLAGLVRLVDRFEDRMPDPRRISGTDADYARRIVAGTVGFRLEVTRIEAKAKLSQDKPEPVVRGILAGLEGAGPYADPELAARMRSVRGG